MSTRNDQVFPVSLSEIAFTLVLVLMLLLGFMFLQEREARELAEQGLRDAVVLLAGSISPWSISGSTQRRGGRFSLAALWYKPRQVRPRCPFHSRGAALLVYASGGSLCSGRPVPEPWQSSKQPERWVQRVMSRLTNRSSGRVRDKVPIAIAGARAAQLNR